MNPGNLGAAALWIGGGIFLALSADGRERVAASPGLRETFAACVSVFVVSGVLLAMQRLAGAPLPPAYVAVLGIKVGLGLWMFMLARRVGRSEAELMAWRRPEWQFLAVGVAIYALSIVLRAIYEGSLRG